MTEELVAKIWNKVKSMDGKIDTMNNRLNNVESKMNSMDDRLNNVESKVNSMDDRLNNVENRLLNIETTVDDIKETFSLFAVNCEKEFKRINKKLDTIESKQYTNKRNIAENSLEISNIQRKIK